jgi:hypothetical protein
LFFFVFGIVVNWLVSCPGHVIWWDLTAMITAEEFDNPALDTVNIFPESDDEIQIDGHGLSTSYAGGPYRILDWVPWLEDRLVNSGVGPVRVILVGGD